MHVPTICDNTNVLVVGLGKSGVSAITFLQSLGAQVRVSDSGSMEDHAAASVVWLEERDIAYEFGGHTQEFCLSADLILVSPGVPHRIDMLREARRAGIPVIGELALAPRYLKTPVVAVTGTNGKTTVATLLGQLFQSSGKKVFVGGNIGVPLTEYLAGQQDADWVVLEVSSFQLDAAGDFRPEIGILLNVSPDHLDRYDTYEDYIDTKLRLFQNQREGDVAIFNGDDEDSLKQVKESKILRHGRAVRRSLFFGTLANHSGAEWKRSRVVLSGDVRFEGEEYPLQNTSLAYSPNLENGAAAILAARVAGCFMDGIRKGIAEFQSLPHRMTFVAELNGVQYIDDSKATNIGASCAALHGLSRPIVLIAGGRDKGGDYRLMEDLISRKVKAMLVIGEAREMMMAQFGDVTRVECVDSLAQAVCRAHEIAHAGDVVLLSPACASFDMFESYAHRGQVFQKLVAALDQ